AGRLAAPAEVYAWRFASGGRSVVIAWSLAAPQQLVLPAGWRAVDIVGRPVTRPRLDGEPLYLLHDQADAALDLGL
ncbi:MAG: hypothetical protein HUU35_19695, partial [Armatimonadetes bacterium]|nr:hypothetical protein [Armatimonadota bacterium]